MSEEIARTYTVRGRGEAIATLEKVMLTMRQLGREGASREVRFSFDGDGPDKLEIAELSSRKSMANTDPSTVAAEARQTGDEMIDIVESINEFLGERDDRPAPLGHEDAANMLRHVRKALKRKQLKVHRATVDEMNHPGAKPESGFSWPRTKISVVYFQTDGQDESVYRKALPPGVEVVQASGTEMWIAPTRQWSK